MKISCPNCGAPIPADKINIQETLAVCPRCDTVFRFDRENVRTIARRKGRKLKKPEKIHVSEDENGVTIRYRWLGNHNGLLITRSIILAVLGIFFTALGLTIIGGSEIILTLIGLGMLVGGLSSFYRLISLLINSNIIRLTDEILSHSEEPLYVFNNRKIPRDEIQQVIVEDSAGESAVLNYSNIFAVMENGTKRELVHFIQTDFALYIGQVLSEYFEENSLYSDALDSSRLDLDAGEPGSDDFDISDPEDEQQVNRQ